MTNIGEKPAKCK